MARHAPGVVSAVAILLLIPAIGTAQTRADADHRNGSGRYFDYFLSHWWTADGAERQNGAVGGRLMWAVPRLTHSESPLPRAYVGGYVMRLRGGDSGQEIWHYGTQADLSLAPAPLFGRVEPIVSVSVGALRVSEDARAAVAERTTGPAGSATALTFAPGIGARIRLLPNLELRSDLRHLREIGTDARGYLEMAGGLSLGA